MKSFKALLLASILVAVVVVPFAMAGDAAKGQKIYQRFCIACHNPDPTQDGSVGPAVAGSSVELITARLQHGNKNFAASYPPGYTPQRDTQLMPPIPNLVKSAEDLAAFLNQ